jgi:hypothetical protein
MTNVEIILQNYHNNAPMLAKELIQHSKDWDEWVHVDHTDDLEYELTLECDDSAENGNIYDFWGEDWRISLHSA